MFQQLAGGQARPKSLLSLQITQRWRRGHLCGHHHASTGASKIIRRNNGIDSAKRRIETEGLKPGRTCRATDLPCISTCKSMQRFCQMNGR